MQNRLFYSSIAMAIIAFGSASFLILRHHRMRATAVSEAPRPPMIDIQKRGEEIYRQKIYAPLVETYKKMLAQMPEDIELKKKLAFAYFGAADYGKAKPLLDEVKDTKTADAETFYELGFIAEGEGKAEIAGSFFRRALEIDPGHSGANEKMGKTR